VNNGTTNWYELAKVIVEEYKRQQTIKAWPSLKVVNIQAITTQDYPTPAARPKNSCLDISKLQCDFSVRLPYWRDALVKELQELQV
jgi:dTDP-4-dehydrorhamnose reductase